MVKLKTHTYNQPYETWLQQLQSSGYRLTAPRRVIIKILATSQRALSPVDVYDLGRQQYPQLGLVTVYRTLEKIEELGLIQRVHQPSGCHMYLPAADGHVHLLLCTTCGKAYYFSGDILETLMETVTQQTGFDIQDHWLQFFGVCANCQGDSS